MDPQDPIPPSIENETEIAVGTQVSEDQDLLEATENLADLLIDPPSPDLDAVGYHPTREDQENEEPKDNTLDDGDVESLGGLSVLLTESSGGTELPIRPSDNFQAWLLHSLHQEEQRIRADRASSAGEGPSNSSSDEQGESIPSDSEVYVPTDLDERLQLYNDLRADRRQYQRRLDEENLSPVAEAWITLRLRAIEHMEEVLSRAVVENMAAAAEASEEEDAQEDEVPATELPHMDLMEPQPAPADLTQLAFHSIAQVIDERPSAIEVLERLTRVTVDGQFLQEHDRICAICMEMWWEGDVVTILPCSHYFHDECVAHWFRQSGSGPSCPMCRRPIVFAFVPA